MAMTAEVIAGILVVLLLVATVLALVIGTLGGVFGEGFERCGRCGRLTLSIKGEAHPDGCPVTPYSQVTHVAHAAMHHAHFRHH